MAAFLRPENESGIDCSVLDRAFNPTACVEICPPDWIVSDAASVLDLDLRHGAYTENRFEVQVELAGTRSCKIDGLVGWFDTEMVDDIILSTSPFAPPTHWQQTMFHFQKPINIEMGENIACEVSITPKTSNHRGVNITLKLKPLS
jgi:hypothetical protein